MGAILCGCRAPKASPESVAIRPKPSPILGPEGVRNNAYSLLSQLMEDQGQVNLVLLIKKQERPEFDALIKEIGRASEHASDQLKDFTRQDRSLVLDAQALPPAEQATRDAIAQTRKSEILGTSGAEFEQHLLLAQVEALSYATHLAQIAAKNDANPGRSQYLIKLSGQMRDLHLRAIKLLTNQRVPVRTADTPRN